MINIINTNISSLFLVWEELNGGGNGSGSSKFLNKPHACIKWHVAWGWDGDKKQHKPRFSIRVIITLKGLPQKVLKPKTTQDKRGNIPATILLEAKCRIQIPMK